MTANRDRGNEGEDEILAENRQRKIKQVKKIVRGGEPEVSEPAAD